MNDVRGNYERAKKRYEELSRSRSESKGKLSALAESAEKTKAEILTLTKLTDIKQLPDFMAKLEKDVNLKQSVLSEKVAEMEKLEAEFRSGLSEKNYGIL